MVVKRKVSEEAQETAAADDLSVISAMVGICIIAGAFLWGTGFFDWDYNDPNPKQGAVVQPEVNPDGYFSQQKCDFLWFGCYTLYSNFRLGVVDGDNLGHIVVTPEEFEEYPAGTYYPKEKYVAPAE